jgi:hypothetical protein
MTDRIWQLRTMGVAELLDATIRLFRKNFLTFVAIVAVVQVPLLVINGLLSVPASQATQDMTTFNPYTFDPEIAGPEAPPQFFPSGFGRYFLWLGLQLLVSVVLGLVAMSLMTGAMAWAVSERYLDRPVTVGRAYRAVFRRWKSLLGGALLLLLVYIAIAIFGIVPCIGWLAVIPAALFAYTCLHFVPQAVMLEGQRAADGLKRSWYLAKPHFWRVLGILAVLWLFSMLVTSGPSLLVSYALVALSPSLLVRSLLGTAVSMLLSLLYLPIQYTGLTLVYYDLRMRQEGLDLELELEALARAPTSEAVEMGAIPAPAAPEPAGAGIIAGPAEAAHPLLPPAPLPREPFLNNRDWRNLAILLGVGLGIMALCCVLYFILIAAMTAVSAPFMERMMQMMTTTPLP